MNPTKKWVPLGKVLREWGVRGQVKCACFNPESSLFGELKKMYLKFPDGFQPLEVEDARPHDDCWRLKFKGYDTPERAKELRGLLIGVPREELPSLDSGELYVSDLVGLKVEGPEGQSMGLVQGVQTSGESELLLIGEDLATAMAVPYEEDFVAATDMEGGKVLLKPMALELLEL